ncbi:hypothetical protein [Flammeovirga pacifica]|uniref:Uncharacterized protein n=1 Tax=Flammeovirga pacifica TaxID=915059 RepID=A0A1S1Z0Z9_FLAPC|nr:hypothetical protein [Flammeovirga pacifica]OHX66940.1 hypothetical protein NH26_11585 [Flammeovirga pacifica]
MKLKRTNLDLGISITWFRQDLVENLLKTLPFFFFFLVCLIAFFSLLLSDPNIQKKDEVDLHLFEVLTTGGICYLIGLISTNLYFGSSYIKCDAEKLVYKNPRNKEVQIPVNQIAQLYLINNTSHTQKKNKVVVHLILRTKENEDIYLFEDRTFSAEKGRTIEEAIEQFLGLDDYAIEGEYHMIGHQKNEHQLASTYNENLSVGKVIDVNQEHHLLEKNYQLEWDNQRVDNILWANNGIEEKIIYLKHSKYYLEQPINPTKFFINTFFKETIKWSELTTDFKYQSNSYTLEEEVEGKLFPDYSISKSIHVNQKVYKSDNNRIIIRQFLGVNFEVSKVEEIS